MPDLVDDLSLQVVVALDTGGGPMPLGVGDPLDTVIEKIRQATVGGTRKGLTFRQPMGGGRVHICDARQVLVAYEQFVQTVRDPRQAGMFRTPSGIDLPRN